MWADGHARQSEQLLGDVDRFYDAATEMLREWPTAARHNLDYMWSGRNAWVGQATCTYVHGAPAAATRHAWAHLSAWQQRAANAVAVQVRTERERGKRGSETLFAV